MNRTGSPVAYEPVRVSACNRYRQRLLTPPRWRETLSPTPGRPPHATDLGGRPLGSAAIHDSDTKEAYIDDEEQVGEEKEATTIEDVHDDEYNSVCVEDNMHGADPLVYWIGEEGRAWNREMKERNAQARTAHTTATGRGGAQCQVSQAPVMPEHLAAERARIMRKAVAALEPRDIDLPRGPPQREAEEIVLDFGLLSMVGYGPEEKWKLLSGRKEIVGVGVTGGMGDALRRHFDLIACGCADRITESLTSEFDALNDLLPVCVGPFIGRLIEMASRERCQGPNLTAVYESTRILLKLMCRENCRRLFVPFESQLQLIASRMMMMASRMAPLHRKGCSRAAICDSFLSGLARTNESSSLNPLLNFIHGWDLLPHCAPKDSVAFLMQSNVTARIISGLLQFCCKFSQQEASLVNLVWLIENVLSALNMLCSVDPSNGDQAVLQFVEENIEGSNDMFQRGVSSLMIMPVIVTGGTVGENLVMKSLMIACDEDSSKHWSFTAKEVASASSVFSAGQWNLIVDAITLGHGRIAELLLCHGVCFPESALNGRTTLELNGEFVDAHHPSVWRFFNTTPTWDPQKHKLFPWWFKVLILNTILLCWLRNTNTYTESAKSTATQPGHCSIGRLSRFNVHLILSFLSPVHWF
ncbi:hypothetical protein Pelo_17708 [Pelomyxa schiedti]|nr:hypothetical protein Pelo_17708 [Pelomyxa schiedti]